LRGQVRSVIELNAKVPDSALQFTVAEQQQASQQIADLLSHERYLGRA
jgi:hypothetical protein